MHRFFALVLASALPPCAHAFQDQVMYLNGVKITATHSATRLCGVDFVIAVSDGDQHFVKIDYSYNGTFKDNSVADDLPMNLQRRTSSDKINVSVGRWTLDGNLARVAAPEVPANSLVCREAWVFHFTASEYNASQAQRSYEDELKRKEQARLDEIARRKAEEAERKRKAEQQQQDYKNAQEKAKRDQLREYKNASPENARCIINEPADIARCEQAKARERADLRKRQAEAIDAQKQRDAKALADARQAEQFKQSELMYDRLRADPCGVAADQARKGPPVQQQVQPNSAAAMQQAAALAQWKQAQAGLEAMCAASKTQAQIAAPPDASPTQEEQTRLQTQQKAQADLDAAIQEGRNTVGAAVNTTQTMQNDNASLMNMINNMK